ncbi:hypothetical protein [Aeromicrobium sp. UC242_57]|uniref:hypothetical protein n=1 Tax=Aeromicrobium sp. UC242_57 TaxID=3374624 RepID=UPI0037A1D16E
MFTRSRHALTAGLLATALVATMSIPLSPTRKTISNGRRRKPPARRPRPRKISRRPRRAHRSRCGVEAGAGATRLGSRRAGKHPREGCHREGGRPGDAGQANRSQVALETARVNLKKGEKKLKASAASVEEFAVQEFLQGDPKLRAVSGLLRGEDAEEFG